MGWNNPWQTRRESQIARIGIHHSATVDGNMRAFENYWRTLGWRNGGYHEIILRNGDVEICYVPTTVVNGVGDHNLNTYHICTVGNSNFTKAQEQTLIERIRHNMNGFNVPVERVLGHNEFPGHNANICPGRNMNNLRQSLMLPQVVTNPNQSVNTRVANVHVVRAGETLTAIAQKNRITIDELQRLNDITNSNLILVDQVLRLPDLNRNTNMSTQVNANKHHVIRPTPGFRTAADARNFRNQKTIVAAGLYHIFNQSNGMINVTVRQGVPGSWINPTK